jgi:hypothetical protein
MYVLFLSCVGRTLNFVCLLFGLNVRPVCPIKFNGQHLPFIFSFGFRWFLIVLEILKDTFMFVFINNVVCRPVARQRPRNKQLYNGSY